MHIAKSGGRNTIHVVFLALLLAALVCAATIALSTLMPTPSGEVEMQDGGSTMDASHSDQGYIMVKHQQTEKRLKLRVTLGKSNYTYDLRNDGEYETFPLQMGDGKYKVQIFKQASGNKYSADASFSLKVTLADETLPYLYPNQYVSFTDTSAAVTKANEICSPLSSDQEKVEAVYAFITSNIVYDHIRALSVESGYIPDVDAVLAEQKGICFDYSALMASMLRSQGIPVQLVIGYADKTYHAWNNVLVNGAWVLFDTTADANNMKVKRYTEERVY